MINGQREIWISTGNKANYSSAIIAVSNCGRIMRRNGTIEIASCRQQVYVREKRSRMLMYRFLATTFITKTEEDILKQRNFIDHITHAPDSMYVNDIRNLRWCTQKENCNFKEAKLKQSKAKIGNTYSKGCKLSAETRAKMSAARKGMKFTDEHRAKMSAAKKGKKLSAEHRAKISTAKKGRLWYNNGITSIRAKECPDDFVPGMLRKF